MATAWPWDRPQGERFTPEERWRFSRDHLGFVRAVVARLDRDELEAFRARFVEIARAYDGRPLHSTLILGRRR